MKNCVRVAAAAVESRPGALEANLEKMDAWCARAARAGAELILFPELSLTGFVPNHPVGDHEQWLRRALREARGMAQALDGAGVRGLQELAARHGLMVSAGLLEDAGNLLFNTHVLVGADGLMGAWRKLHIPMFEMPFYGGGPAPEVAATELGRIGVNICFDALLPESTRLLAVKNVEIVLFPFAADPEPKTPEGWAAWAGTALRARCAENGVFGLAVNYAGYVEMAGASQTFPGGALALGPRGENLETRVENGLTITELRAADLEAARAEPEYLYRFRRPELYGALAR